MKLRSEHAALRKPELVTHHIENGGERVRPLGAHQILRDLPGIPDLRIGQRLLATPEPRTMP